MKQGIAVMISLSLYLGSLFLIDSAIAGGHKGAEGCLLYTSDAADE